MSTPAGEDARDADVVAIPKATVESVAAAREQADEYGSLLASTAIKLADGEVFWVPHREMLDPDQDERMNELLSAIRGFDREPDVVGADGTVIARGPLIEPHHHKGKLVRPPYAERVGIALWGEQEAKRFRAGGGNFNEILMIWNRKALAWAKMRERDFKS